MKRLSVLALVFAAALLCGCADFGLRIRTRLAVAVAPPCPAEVAPWCTTPGEAGTVYYTGAPFQVSPKIPTPFCRCR